MDAHTMEQPTPAAAGTGATVLVVDDEPIVREVVATYLRREGYRALEAGDGLAARDLIERTRPLTEANEALADLAAGRVLRSILVP